MKHDATSLRDAGFDPGVAVLSDCVVRQPGTTPVTAITNLELLTRRRRGRLNARWAIAASLLIVGGLCTSGCVSTRHQMAKEYSPPSSDPVASAIELPLSATVSHVVVFRGPGSWKRDAYWDEYVVSLSNRGTEPVVVRDVRLLDRTGTLQRAALEPWSVEAVSQQRLKVYAGTDPSVMLGAGLAGASAILQPITQFGLMLGSTAPIVMAGAALTATAPVVVGVTRLETNRAKAAIEAEFQDRRIDLPLELLPGALVTGSFFFPITPGPQVLIVRYHSSAGTKELRIPLTAISSLHLTNGIVTP